MKSEELSKLHDLKGKGAITEKEYECAKRNLLGSMRPSVLPKLVDYLRISAWPFVLLVLVFWFRAPLLDKLRESSELSLGAFSIRVKEKAVQSGSPELGRLLSGLPPSTVVTLLQLQGSVDLAIQGATGAPDKTVRLVKNFDDFVRLQKANLATSKVELNELLEVAKKKGVLNHRIMYEDPNTHAEYERDWPGLTPFLYYEIPEREFLALGGKKTNGSYDLEVDLSAAGYKAQSIVTAIVEESISSKNP